MEDSVGASLTLMGFSTVCGHNASEHAQGHTMSDSCGNMIVLSLGGSAKI